MKNQNYCGVQNPFLYSVFFDALQKAKNEGKEVAQLRFYELDNDVLIEVSKSCSSLVKNITKDIRDKAANENMTPEEMEAHAFYTHSSFIAVNFMMEIAGRCEGINRYVKGKIDNQDILRELAKHDVDLITVSEGEDNIIDLTFTLRDYRVFPLDSEGGLSLSIALYKEGIQSVQDSSKEEQEEEEITQSN